MFDSKTLVSLISAAGLVACAVILVWRGDLQHAMTIAALLVPSIGQLTPPTKQAPTVTEIK